jgi:prolyl oligopeptidase
LFGAVLCAVPLLDMIRYQLFGSGKTWIPEYGDPEKAEDFGWLYPYSPYHHVQDGVGYPSMLMLSADHDDRVDPMHARKFTARVRAASKGGPALLRIEMNAGHGGADQVAKNIVSSVDQVAFLFGQFGMKPPAPAVAPAPAAATPPSAGGTGAAATKAP